MSDGERSFPPPPDFQASPSLNPHEKAGGHVGKLHTSTPGGPQPHSSGQYSRDPPNYSQKDLDSQMAALQTEDDPREGLDSLAPPTDPHASNYLNDDFRRYFNASVGGIRSLSDQPGRYRANDDHSVSRHTPEPRDDYGARSSSTATRPRERSGPGLPDVYYKLPDPRPIRSHPLDRDCNLGYESRHPASMQTSYQPLHRSVTFENSPSRLPRRTYYEDVPPPAGNQTFSRRKELQPSRFDGKSDWVDYLDHFSAVSEWNRWSDEEKGLQLAMSLTDGAREVLGSLGAAKYDYQQLTNALTNRYAPEGRDATFCHALMNASCKPGQDVNAFGHELRRLAAKAYPQGGLDEKILVSLFIQGLPEKELKKHVYLQHPTTLTAAVNLAVNYEAFESTDKVKKPKPTVAAAQSKSNTNAQVKNMVESLTQDVSNLTMQVDSLKFPQQPTRQPHPRNMQYYPAPQNRPSYRNNPPHNSMSYAPNTRQGPNSSNRRSYQAECYSCGQPGHFRKNCPQQHHTPNMAYYNHRPAAPSYSPTSAPSYPSPSAPSYPLPSGHQANVNLNQ